MTPEGGLVLRAVAVSQEQPWKTYRMEPESGQVAGHCDGLQAMEQAVYKILMTERYRYVIYSWNYGIELEGLFGMPVDWVCPELERRITEALTQDDRIIEVKDFQFDVSTRGKVLTLFTVVTKIGEFRSQREVMV